MDIVDPTPQEDGNTIGPPPTTFNRTTTVDEF